MSLAHRLPLSFRGTLHDVRLVNFSLDYGEAEALLPQPLRAGTFRGRALVSMVSVYLRAMRPAPLPALCGFGYRHVAFRLLLDDSRYTGDRPRGIYFLRSFVRNPLLALGGRLLTDFRFSTARVEQTPGSLLAETDDGFVTARFSDTETNADPELCRLVGAVDRAYAVHNGTMYSVRIQRQSWPLRPLACTHFATTFFHSARFEGAFTVPGIVPYMWLPPREIPA